ncbi:MAG: IS5/IS1182 family transposase, partial [Acinetobacter sp.]
MRYKNLTGFNDKEFKRLVGVPRPLFAQMITI